MTAEQRVVIEISDVDGFEFECLRCKGRFYIPIGKFDAVRTTCPNCRDAWFKTQGSPEHVLVHEFLDNFKRIAELVAPLSVTIRFQISEGALNGRKAETGRAKESAD